MAKSVELGPIKSPPARAMFSGNGLATSPSIVGRSGSSEPRLRTTGAAVGGGDDGGLGGGVAKLDVGCGVATGPVVESVAEHQDPNSDHREPGTHGDNGTGQWLLAVWPRGSGVSTPEFRCVQRDRITILVDLEDPVVLKSHSTRLRPPGRLFVCVRVVPGWGRRGVRR
jgi:hypothetical protein